MELNAAQKKAVEHKSGPLIVIAGAGTGKTRVIVERIKTLIDEGVRPEEIVALTFTEKASAEMQDRVSEITGKYLLEVNIATYNSFGEKILRKYSNDIGLSSNFKLLNRNSMAVLVRQNLDNYRLDYYKPIGDPSSYIKDLLDYFSTLKQLNITPDDYTKLAAKLGSSTPEDVLEKKRHTELSLNYKIHQNECLKLGVIDYDDQIFLALRILKEKQNILARIQKKYKHFMVDEYQDTNKMQAELVSLLAGEEKNIMVVGDDDQAIYGFRGATIENILSFKDKYTDSEEITLVKNYRSSQEILDTAYRLIQNNNPDRLEATLSLDKKLKSEITGKPPEYREFRNLDDELSWLADDIRDKIDNGTNPNDIAILVRKNSLSVKLLARLEGEGVKGHIAGQTHQLFDETVVIAILNVLKLITRPNDDSILYQVLSGRLFGQYSKELAIASDVARRNHESLTESIKGSDDLNYLNKALEMIDTWRSDANINKTDKVVYQIITDTGLKDRLITKAYDDSTSAKEIMYISQLFEIIGDYLASSVDKSLNAFVNDLELLSELTSNNSDDVDYLSEDGVTIMTIHKSKGLEWSAVYIPNLVQGNFPGTNRSAVIEAPDEYTEKVSRERFIQEERRLMYVAATRAKQELILSMSYDHGGARNKKPSIFVEETELKVTDVSVKAKQPELFSIENANRTNSDIVLPSRFIKSDWLSLSVSQVNDYRRCPLDFYYRHVLMVPQEKHVSSGVGTAVHDVLQRFNEDFEANNVGGVSSYLTFLSELWPSDGYETIKEKEESLARASSKISSYLRQELNSARHPNLIEKSFNVSFTEAKVKIRGRFDAVYDYEDYLEIKDYKTSTTNKNEDSLKKSASRSDQLTLYALIWQEMTGNLPDHLTLDYVLAGKRATISKQQRSIDKFREELLVISERIKNLDFTPASNHMFCRHD